ncbi:MAG: tRNA dihydrouridine synthase DusB [Deltaproteobacteria bacterium]|nr:tRNA dihydrouridine synthase DusB [Deltaproteobacteria bacterium]
MEFRGKLILAPMAGITDTTFRLICRENGADAVLTEMASAKGLLMQPERTRRFLEYSVAERPIGAQLFGASPVEIGEAAAAVGGMGFDFVDINMGCPVRKVTGGGAGSALLANPVLAGEIAAAAVRNAGIPVTAKIRAGFGADTDGFLDVARAVFEAGAAAVTLHPRTRGQMFSGLADWSRIAALKMEFPDRIIIGNGDVRTPGDAARMISETGCDAVMVGRAALGNPWVFREMRNDPARLFAPAGPAALPSAPALPAGERRAVILRHGEEMHRRLGNAGIRDMRKHLAWYSRGIPGAAAFRGDLVRVSTLEDFRAAVERFY